MKTLVVFGATSAIAQAYAGLVSVKYEKVLLIARNTEATEQIATHLRVISNAVVEVITEDLSVIAHHEKLVEQVFSGSVDTALIAYGELTDQIRCINDTEYAMQQFNLNGTSTISLSVGIARKMAEQGSGSLAVIGSVAGDRGRRSNYYYGTAKSAVASFLSGLRSDMQSQGVNVITVKPGFVDTPMTSEFKKGLLWASAEKVASDIDKAVSNNKSVIYTPWFWRFIMLVIKSIPEALFKRLPL